MKNFSLLCVALAMLAMGGCAPLTVVRQEVVTVKKVDGETTTTTTTTTTETPVVQLIHAPSCYSCRYPMAQVCWWEYHDRHAFEVCRPVVTPLPQVTIRGWRWYNPPRHHHPPPRRRH